MVVVAQLVEHRFVEAKVTRAALVYHPKNMETTPNTTKTRRKRRVPDCAYHCGARENEIQMAKSRATWDRNERKLNAKCQ